MNSWNNYLQIKSKSEFITRLNMQYKWIYGQIKIINSLIPLGSCDRVLEIGAGVGALLKILKEKGVVDIQATELDDDGRKLIKEYLNIDVKSITLEDENFYPESKFDKIYALEVIEHLQNPNIALKILFEKLADNGILIISTPPPNCINLRDKTHYFVMNSICWVRNIESAGFKSVETIPMTGIPFLYKFSKHLSLHLPINFSAGLFHTTNFYICKK